MRAMPSVECPCASSDGARETLPTIGFPPVRVQREAQVPQEEATQLRHDDAIMLERQQAVFSESFEAIDQLLGYATWRDSKTAILVFNRGTETSTVLTGIDATVKAHANFKRAMNWPHESGFRYVLHGKGDTNREQTLTVLVFHVPK